MTRSTCSESATARGKGQRVISFAFYKEHAFKEKLPRSTFPSTDDRFEGIRQNLLLVEKYYPAYTMRLYTDITETTDAKRHSNLCNMYCSHPQLDICNVYSLGK